MYYFAYGSNLHPLRLVRRISSAKLISTASINGYQLKFNKKGQDNSSKCNIGFTGHQLDTVYGAVYEIKQKELTILDKIEGLNDGYVHQKLVLNILQKPSTALTYIAMPEFLDGQDKPFSWYKDLVISGMEYLEFSKAYIEPVRSLEGKEDWNLNREKRMMNLLTEMREMSTNISVINGIN